MTGDDLKRMQDGFLKGAKTLLCQYEQLRPVGFVITLYKHVEKLFESGWGIEFIDPKSCVGVNGDGTATLVLDLTMGWKRLYHAVVTVFPETKEVLSPMITLAETIAIDDPYKRVMRPFLAHTQMDEKDIIAATMRHVCGKVDAYASIFQAEAWRRDVDLDKESEADVPQNLSNDAKAVEVIISSMETYDFTRMLSVPIVREGGKKRDAGKVVGFGELVEGLDTLDNTNVVDGRLARFLKPLEIAS
jgi:hypothetical protein